MKFGSVFLTLFLALPILTLGRLNDKEDGNAIDDVPDDEGLASMQRRNLMPVNGKIPGSYVIVFDESVEDVEGKTKEILEKAGDSSHFDDGPPFVQYHYNKGTFKGANIRNLHASAVEVILGHEGVISVEEDGVHRSAKGSPKDWGLDRINQDDLPLDKNLMCPGDGKDITIYILDTGILKNHFEFEGRLDFAKSKNFDTMVSLGLGNWNDQHGHGTHVAGTAAGKTVGVASKATLVAYRVLNKYGFGASSDILAGITAVPDSDPVNGKRNIANLSLGGPVQPAFDLAVKGLRSMGTIVVVAAGNSASDAQFFSPAREPTAITVGATTVKDNFAAYSNWGSVVDILAPGSYIYSAWVPGKFDYNTISGTSMAAPHVAGVVALIWQLNPMDDATAIEQLLFDRREPDTIAGVPIGTANEFLQCEPEIMILPPVP